MPYRFAFFDEDDKFRLNSLVRSLLNQNNFNVYYDIEDKPEDLLADPCLGMYLDVENNSNILRKRLTLKFKDCGSNVIYSTDEHVSKIKDFQEAYQDAARSAFEEIAKLNYVYNPLASAESIQEAKQKNKPTASVVEALSDADKKALLRAVKNHPVSGRSVSFESVYQSGEVFMATYIMGNQKLLLAVDVEDKIVPFAVMTPSFKPSIFILRLENKSYGIAEVDVEKIMLEYIDASQRKTSFELVKSVD
ncbi:MAG: hypothetical protein RQ756_08220 [Flavobacteriaceae bacterium]|nr:hypothetical protein [Flavobacteriaceae bacterium]